MPATDDVLDAIGDGTRRRVLELLRHGPRTVGDLASDLPVSRPAVSKHLKVLLDAGLVRVEQVGTRRHHELDLAGLARARDWVERFWDDALDAFEEHLARTEKTTNEDQP